MEKESINFALPALRFNLAELAYQGTPWRQAHVHDSIEIIHVDGGEIRAQIGEEIYTARAGDTLLVNSNVVHALENVRDARIAYMQLETEARGGAADGDSMLYGFCRRQGSIPACVIHEEGELCRIFSAIRDEMREKRPYYEKYVKAYIDLLLSVMLRHRIVSDMDAKTRACLDALLPVAAHVEMYYAGPIPLEDLAEVAGCSKFELCRRFRAATGRTLVDYMNYVRLRRAEQMLEDGERVTDIAFACGFSSVQYFNKVFRRYNGCTPGKYRREAP